MALRKREREEGTYPTITVPLKQWREQNAELEQLRESDMRCREALESAEHLARKQRTLLERCERERYVTTTLLGSDIRAHLDGTHKAGWSDMLGILQDGSATPSSELATHITFPLHIAAQDDSQSNEDGGWWYIEDAAGDEIGGSYPLPVANAICDSLNDRYHKQADDDPSREVFDEKLQELVEWLEENVKTIDELTFVICLAMMNSIYFRACTKQWVSPDALAAMAKAKEYEDGAS